MKTTDLVLLALLLGLSGCDDGVRAGDTVDAGLYATPDPDPTPIVPSTKARLKYKPGAQYATDLAAALSISRSDVCVELGQYDCVDAVHRITLGGVEPYRLGVRTPLNDAPLTRPIAQDRVALAACARGVDLDLARDESLWMASLRAAGDAAPADMALANTVDALYRRLLSRRATSEETAALVDFYAEVAEVNGGPSARTHRDWAVGSCFAVATTLEALFY